jgi:hypothetical protein
MISAQMSSPIPSFGDCHSIGPINATPTSV